MEIFSSRLRDTRGMTSQKAFAAKLGLSQQTYGHYEKGDREPGLETLQRIGVVCGVSIDWLLGLSQSRDASVVAPNNSGAIASGPNAQATLHAAPAVPSPPSECARCLLMQEHIRRITGRG